eukprot:2758099-Rhodomonas_salina.1
MSVPKRASQTRRRIAGRYLLAVEQHESVPDIGYQTNYRYQYSTAYSLGLWWPSPRSTMA